MDMAASGHFCSDMRLEREVAGGSIRAFHSDKIY